MNVEAQITRCPVAYDETIGAEATALFTEFGPNTRDLIAGFPMHQCDCQLQLKPMGGGAGADKRSHQEAGEGARDGVPSVDVPSACPAYCFDAFLRCLSNYRSRKNEDCCVVVASLRANRIVIEAEGVNS